MGMHTRTKVWLKGSYRGMPLYTLTLEERKTCPNTCIAWKICYGNNMPFTTRFDTSDEGARLMGVLEKELDELDATHQQGYSVRLHVLGDFFSKRYVQWWEQQVQDRPGLHVFGFTHRHPAADLIGRVVDRVFRRFGHRFNILLSDPPWPVSGRPVALLESTPGAAKLPLCPVEAGKRQACLECGLCTLTYIKGVRFKIH